MQNETFFNMSFYLIIGNSLDILYNYKYTFKKICKLFFKYESWYFVLGFGKLSWSSISDFFSWSSETKVDLKDLNIWDNTTY